MSTAAERTVDNPLLSAAFHQRAAQEEHDRQEFSELALRLMGRAHQKTFPVSLDDGLEVEVYAPTDGEVLDLIKLQTDIYRVGVSMQGGKNEVEAVLSGVDAIAEGFSRVNRLLAKLTVDPSLNYEFFASGSISADDKAAIIGGILNRVKAGQEQIGRFRKK